MSSDTPVEYFFCGRWEGMVNGNWASGVVQKVMDVYPGYTMEVIIDNEIDDIAEDRINPVTQPRFTWYDLRPNVLVPMEGKS